MSHTIAVLGGTGPQGRGLAYRFALAGHRVIIGSRSVIRATETAQEINDRLDSPRATGAVNRDAVDQADCVLLSVPWAGHTELVMDLADDLGGKVVITCVNPLGFDKMGAYGLPLEESAAEEAARLAPGAAVVGAFHHVAAHSLWQHDGPMAAEDVLVCGDDTEAKHVVRELAKAVTSKPGIDVGGLRVARQLEPLTAVLISMNRLHKTRTGIAITGLGLSA